MTESLAPIPQSPKANSRLGALDGLRGFAVFLVLIDHAADKGLFLFKHISPDQAGKLGVYLFFVLSAFLLTHLLLQLPAAELLSVRTWENYFVRRFLRIFPLYALVLVVLYFLPQGEIGLGQIISHLLLQDGVNHFWTIPVEVKYYFLLPPLVLTISFLFQKKWIIACITLLFTYLLIKLGVLFEDTWSFNNRVKLSENPGPFLAGTCAALLHGFLEKHPRFVAKWAYWLEGIALVAFLMALSRIPGFFQLLQIGSFPKTEHNVTLCGILWAIFLIGMLHGKGMIRKVFEWGVLRYLGWVSFSAYLFNYIVLNSVRELPYPPQVVLVIFILAITALASVSYYLIERPLSRIRLKPRPVETNTPALS